MERPKIQVVVRKRPLSAREIRKSQTDIVSVDTITSLTVKEEK